MRLVEVIFASKSTLHVSVNKQICTTCHKIDRTARTERKRGKFEGPTNLAKLNVICAGNNKVKNDMTVTKNVLLTLTSATFEDCHERLALCISLCGKFSSNKIR